MQRPERLVPGQGFVRCGRQIERPLLGRCDQEVKRWIVTLQAPR